VGSSSPALIRRIQDLIMRGITSQGLRGRMLTGRKFLRWRMRSEESERSENAGALVNSIHDGKAMPNEGIALMCRRVDQIGYEREIL